MNARKPIASRTDCAGWTCCVPRQPMSTPCATNATRDQPDRDAAQLRPCRRARRAAPPPAAAYATTATQNAGDGATDSSRSARDRRIAHGGSGSPMKPSIDVVRGVACRSPSSRTARRPSPRARPSTSRARADRSDRDRCPVALTKRTAGFIANDAAELGQRHAIPFERSAALRRPGFEALHRDEQARHRGAECTGPVGKQATR